MASDDRIAVKVIEATDKASLVEWHDAGGAHRVTVPTNKVVNGGVDDDVLQAGIPYGVPWEVVVNLSGLTPETVAAELRRRGIWTRKDMERGVNEARAALTELITPALVSLLEAIRR